MADKNNSSRLFKLLTTTINKLSKKCTTDYKNYPKYGYKLQTRLFTISLDFEALGDIN